MQAVYAFFGGGPQSAAPTEIELRALRYCNLVLNGQYREAYDELRADKSVADEDKKKLMSAVSAALLHFRNLEWTNHGIEKTFRYWNRSEKETYLRQAQAIADELKRLTPFVALGFGAVLGLVRDRDFVPHDDDMDLIIAFEEPMKFAEAKDLVKAHLEKAGYVCHGQNLSHFGVNTGKGRAVDVFIGFVEDDRVSWFPSARRNLQLWDVFPAEKADLFGIELDVPCDAEAYLSATYGEDWRKPIVNFSHPWDARQYRDFM